MVIRQHDAALLDTFEHQEEFIMMRHAFSVIIVFIFLNISTLSSIADSFAEETANPLSEMSSSHSSSRWPKATKALAKNACILHPTPSLERRPCCNNFCHL